MWCSGMAVQGGLCGALAWLCRGVYAVLWHGCAGGVYVVLWHGGAGVYVVLCRGGAGGGCMCGGAEGRPALEWPRSASVHAIHTEV